MRLQRVAVAERQRADLDGGHRVVDHRDLTLVLGVEEVLERGRRGDDLGRVVDHAGDAGVDGHHVVLAVWHRHPGQLVEDREHAVPVLDPRRVERLEQPEPDGHLGVLLDAEVDDVGLEAGAQLGDGCVAAVVGARPQIDGTDTAS